MRTPTLPLVYTIVVTAVGAVAGLACFSRAALADGLDVTGARPATPHVATLFPDVADPVAPRACDRGAVLFCARGGEPCAPCAPTRQEIDRRCQGFFDDYVPVVPVGPSRSTFTTMVVPPTPWLLTQGEAGTPACGRFGFNLTRVSDERVFTDNHSNQYESDGEVQVSVLEAVSPRLHASIGGTDVPYHLALSISAYQLESAWWDGARNFVEKDLLGAEQSIIDSHTLVGSELSITNPAGARTNLLDSSPMWKAAAAIKFPLPDTMVGCHRLSGAFTVELVGPTFGSHQNTGNDKVQGDVTLAAALPLSERWRLTGAGNLAIPGESRTLADFGLHHQTFLGSGILGIEWWAASRFAISLGGTINSPYTKNSGLSTDLTSLYVNFGLMWRLSSRAEIHALFSENPGGKIAVNGSPSTNYTFDTQRDADFSVTIGGTFDL
jgi:hypothetical protein